MGYVGTLKPPSSAGSRLLIVVDDASDAGCMMGYGVPNID